MSLSGVREVLRAGEARTWALAELARPGLTAVRHPLGFVCLPLERDGGEGVCLHLWTDSLAHAESTTSQIHCHSWDLVSHVLYGQVRNVHAVVDDTAERATHRVYEVVSDAGGDRISPTPRTVRHSTGLVEVFGPGDTYTLAADRFHSSVVPEGGEAATIALGRGRPGSRDLSLGPLSGGPHHVSRQPLDASETALAIRTITAHLT
ncbi:unnamed protein product [[Actinomadura] parvosata subsp. kistnae]|uniref:Cysteine dioxygenase n=1 Tax=[Actinomadura] parvosata subsp. kistnae TaxID=1909395 RepID=A0A1V0A3D0_9ACTN|nr:hypothetical protein [Nonomuraea sp. ATCC 55076]AQZ64725.1 hypothetical protein BKM31_27620 [Nonomuraea sp. ATCC 55076]SPL98530.1 unnamed protein product [Actinomadura parvosata subsp. kistnae]